MQISPYLNFNGNCAEAFKFYEKCLGGRIEMMHTYGDSPMKDQMPPEARNRVMHVHLNVGGQTLFGSDSPTPEPNPPHGFHVSIAVDSEADGQRVFRELSAGGQVVMPFEKTFWSPGFGMLVDRFGTPWMVNVNHKG